MSSSQANPKDKKWRTKAFPLYDDLFPLVEKRRATGENVFRVSDAQVNDGDNRDDGGNHEDDDVRATGSPDDSIDQDIIPWVCICQITERGCILKSYRVQHPLLLPVAMRRVANDLHARRLMSQSL